MMNDKTARGTNAAIHWRVSRELASSADHLTAPAVAELTDAEIAMVAGGLESVSRIAS
ncbi:MAG: hypothetical protein WDN44_15805 [Sphingomonas sp.]